MCICYLLLIKASKGHVVKALLLLLTCFVHHFLLFYAFRPGFVLD